MLKEYVLIDLETTGLSAKEDKIIEIGAIKYADGRMTGRLETFVNPGIRIPERITKVTGITDDMVKDAPYIEEVIDKLLSFTKGQVIIGHNIMFDYAFIKQSAVNNKLEFDERIIDTLKLARKFLPEVEKKSLDYLCAYFGIEDKNHHRAINDAQAAGKLYEILCYRFEKEAAEEFMPKEAVCKMKKECPITPRQAQWLKALIEKHNLQVDYEVDKLTKNSASRNIDKILSEYGR